jgi:biopolymer transport protein ExbB
MRLALYFFLLFLQSNNTWAEYQNLDQLLRDVKQSQSIERKINRAREAQFLAEKKTQQQLLDAAKAQLSKRLNHLQLGEQHRITHLIHHCFL